MEIYLVVGKGGVGKTTLSAALALSMEPPLLAFSLDPLPNLCSAVGIECSFKPVKFDDRYFGEVNYEAARELWIKRFGGELKEALRDALGVEDEEIVKHVASSPGIAEQFTLYFVLETAKELGVNRVILDTPPLGPTLRMIMAEKEFYDHLLSASKVYGKIIKLLKLKGSKALEIIEEWRGIASSVLNEVLNAKYVLVSTPERFAREIALKGSEELKRLGLKHWRSYLNKAKRGICLEPPTYAIPELEEEPVGAKALRELLKKAERVC